MDNTLKETLKKVRFIAESILKKNFEPLKDLEIPKKQGIYIIKETSNRFFKNRIFYIGKSTNLYNRIIRHTPSRNNNAGRSGSILRKKLHKRGLSYNEISDYLKNECLFCVQDIKDYDNTALVEDLLIAVLRRKGEPIINDIKT